jgi:DNA-binding transcriptional LysR family regulator
VSVELRDMRWAIVAAQHRSLRQAADTLNVRQSTLSRRLRALEYRLGAVLFERTNGGTRPTRVGREFLDTASRIVEETEAAFARLKSRSHGESGRLAVGVCMALSTGNLRATLMEHQRRYPDVEIHAIDGARRRLFSELSSGMIDIAIMSCGDFVWEDKSLTLWSERVVIALPEDHPLSLRQAIHWRELENERLLATQRDPGPDYVDLLLSKLGRSGNGHLIEHKISLDRLLSLVGAGLGATLVSEGATGASYAGVTYREVHDNEGATRLDFAAYWKETNDNPTLRPFLDMLRERYPDLFGDAPAR